MSINPVLKDGLIKLEMYNTKPTDGLKFVSELKNEENPYIKLHLIDAEKYGATAVYFRHFENRPSIPQIYIYEEQKDINTLHKKLWSSCKVPMFFIFTKTEIKIFNSMSKKNINEEDINPFETIVIASEVQVKLKYFKAKMFDSGEFWNKKYNKNFSHKNSAYNSLLEKLEITRENLVKNNKLSPPLINSLLIKSILLKYLEEKKVFDVEKDYWNSLKKNAKSFQEVCEDNISLINLFDDLSKHFNGGIFKLNDKDKEELKTADLTEFIKFLQSNLDSKNQLRLWDLYSFKDLPIELISNIYELFLTEKEKKGVVYTPSILVDFMIDEMIPLDSSITDFKVIDRKPDLAAYNSAMNIYDHFKKIRDDFNGSDKTVFSFSEEAQPTYLHWLEDHENSIRRTSTNSPAIEALLAKYRSLVPSLALIFHLINTDNTRHVSHEALQLAMHWADFLYNHAKKVYHSVISRDVVCGHALAKKIKLAKVNTGTTVREIYRKEWSQLTNSADVKLAVSLLQDLNWVRVKTIKLETGAPSEVLEINPAFLKK